MFWLIFYICGVIGSGWWFGQVWEPGPYSNRISISEVIMASLLWFVVLPIMIGKQKRKP